MTTNKEKAFAINKAVQSGDVESGAALVTENYIQHTPNVPDGKDWIEDFNYQDQKQRNACA